MAYRIEFDKASGRQLRRLPLDIQRSVRRAVDALADDPRPRGVQKVTGIDNLYRIRVGDYRVAYEIHDEIIVVLVVAVGHRREIYRRLGR